MERQQHLFGRVVRISLEGLHPSSSQLWAITVREKKEGHD